MTAVDANALRPIDIAIMLVYFAGMILIGVRFARSTKTTQGYFIGERKTPSWVLGLSMLAAKISSVTFLAFPAAAYILDWRMLVPNLAIIPIALLAVWLLVPFYRRAAYTTVFEYLHARFGTGARLYCALISLLAIAIKLGSIIYLLSIPLSMFSSIHPVWIMAAVGVFCAVYTIIGGMQAVIWTEAIQAVILYLGGVIALVVMVWGIPGGLTEIFKTGMESDKFGMGAMAWNLNDRTFWTMLILGFAQWISSFTTDQMLIQRYLAAKNVREARVAGLSSSFLCIPTWIFFFFIGTTLFVYYKVNVDPVVATLPADSVFPHFILTKIPHGLSGLVIAAIISAAMGAISAQLNAFATITTVDLVKPYFFKKRSDVFYARTAKVMTAAATVCMLGIGYWFSVATKESFQDLYLEATGLIGGVLPAFFLLGLFAVRTNRKVLWQAFAIAFVANVYLVLANRGAMDAFSSLLTDWGVTEKVSSILMGWNLIDTPMEAIVFPTIHAYWVSAWAVIIMVVSAVLLSWLQRVPPDRRIGLSVLHPLPYDRSAGETAAVTQGSDAEDAVVGK